MLTIFDIAHWFLTKEPMIHKKLQKLCYYSYAWSLVLNEKTPLFEADFEAWAHGPVNRELWGFFKSWGFVNIQSSSCPIHHMIDSKSEEVLERVWQTYGELNGFQLETLSHIEKPWIEARKNIPDFAPSDNVINRETMYEFYKSQYSGDGIGE